MDKALGLLASWVVAADMRTSGLVKTFGGSLVAWSEALLVERARQHLASRSPGPIHNHEAPLATLLRECPPMPVNMQAALRISEILGHANMAVWPHPVIGIVDVVIGSPTGPRSVDEASWRKLIAGGVPLLPWAEIVRLRVALRTGAGGVS